MYQVHKGYIESNYIKNIGDNNQKKDKMIIVWRF